MTEEDGELTVAQRLGRLLDRGLLPAGGPAEAAERLIERLERPARVALLGLPGAGKSSVLNLLAGTVVVPETLRLPTIIVQHGDEARMLCTLADGRIETVPGTNLEQVLTLNPALVTLEMDLPALKVISLLEISAGPMEAEQRRAAVWASKRADILIWCTTSYLPKEQQVWEGMPDTIKDNGFLFLTKTDLLGSPEAARGMLDRVEQRAGEEFRQVLSISAKQARAAMPPGAAVDWDMFRNSGAAAVISTIKTRVQMARRADTDMAELLLARHVEASGIVARRFADLDKETPAEPKAAPEWAPPPEVPAPPADKPPATGRAHQPDPLPRPAPEPEPPIAAKPEPVAQPVAPVPEPAPVAEALPEPEETAEIDLSPEPEPEPEAPEPPATSEPEPDAPATGGGKRLSDRIRQAAPEPDTTAPPLVPLRTTWKSRNDKSGAADAKPKPQQPPTPRKDVPRTPPPARGKVAEPARDLAEEPSASEGLDDAVIAAMLAAAAAAPKGEPRVARERPSPSAAPPAEDVSEERLSRAKLFGTPDPAASSEVSTVEPTPDPDPEVPTRPDAIAAEVSETETAAVVEPDVETPVPASISAFDPSEPRPRISAVATRPSIAPEDLASPRVAVLRERRQDATGAERRERPRIAARVVAPVPAAPVPGLRPVPASEHAILDRAIALIMSRAAELEQLIDPDDKLPVDMILDHGRETTEQVIEVLSDATSAELRRINGDLSEVQDLIMLMQLEKGHAPADDAITLILQIRRDLETLRAA